MADIAGSADCAIRLADVAKNYGKLQAIDGLDLEIDRGEFFGLLGPNGAGKSTTISLLCGTCEPTSGTISICGNPQRPLPMAIKAKLGLVPQEFAFYPPLTARENLSFFGQMFGLQGPRLQSRIAAMLELVGLAERDREPVAGYSGGMKRRLNIAIGFLHEPEILVLDEPTVGVDAQSRNAILSALSEVNARGTTVVYSTHYMEEAERLCGRVAILDYGRVIALDAPRVLIRSVGQGLIELELSETADPESLARITRIPGIRTSHCDANSIALQSADPTRALAEIMDAVRTSNLAVKGLRLVEPSLESVFLTLTGRSLRDDPA